MNIFYNILKIFIMISVGIIIILNSIDYYQSDIFNRHEFFQDILIYLILGIQLLKDTKD